ncbi:MAG: aldehyde dehydrogenase [Rhodospirillaceae bacterium]|nr:aldehyde dehydrogenase [Rhodospirillaceae bacterium]
MLEQTTLTRRDFLVRSGAVGSAAMLSIALPVSLGGLAEAKAAGMSQFTPSIWFTITPDGITTMHIVKTEMGQHIGTALAQIIAEELEVDWNHVVLDYPEGSAENFAKYGLAYTVNSGSVTTEFDRLSRAGAAGRIALIEAAAKLLGANEADCYAENSKVVDKASGRSIAYRDILQQATIERTFAYPDDFRKVEPKPRGNYKIVGKSIPAIDIPQKTNGKAQYGIDVFVPNMCYGALVMPRSRYKAKALSVDETEAKKIPGFLKSVIVNDSSGKCTGWVLALAEKFPQAMKAAKALKVEWDAGPYGDLSLEDIMATYHDLQADPSQGAPWVLEGDTGAAMAAADDVLEMEYTTDMVCHAAMEPRNATVHKVGDTWHVYIGTQSTSFARMTLTGVLAAATGQDASEIKVIVHQFLVGGGFGGKQDYDEIIAAAFASADIGRPVKLIHTRETELATSFARTPTLHKFKAALKDGKLSGMQHDIVCGWMGARFGVGEKYGSDWLQLDADDGSGRDIDQWSIGGSDHWYDIPNHTVRAINDDRTTWAVQASALRTVSNSYNMFVVESFLDEVAHKLGLDPVEFRLSLLDGKGGGRDIPNAGYAPGTPSDYYMDRLWLSLPWPQDGTWIPYESATVGGAKRLANVLRVAAGKAGYGSKTMGKNRGMGVAVSSAEERQSPTWVAGAAEVTVDPESGVFSIDKLTIAMDMGIAVNPQNAIAQIKGSALWGASQILTERLTFKDGAFEQGNFDTYVPIRLHQVPEIDVVLVESGNHPSGVGEPASTVVAPAVANAIFNAVGARVRHMPITPDKLKEALKSA